MSFGAVNINNGPFLRSMLPPYMMPGGCSMTRGGINLPASAAPIPSLTWTGYGPQTGAYAGMAGPAKRMKYRDVMGRGGYTYRQFEDGSIFVLQGPALTGTTLTRTSDPRRWQAITNEIGWFQRQPGTFIQVLPDVLKAVTTVSTATAQAIGPRTTSDLPVEPVPAPMEPESSALPWIVGGGIAAVALLLLLRR